MEESTRQSMGKSEHAEWCTPPELLESVYKVGDVGLDPCSNLWSVVRSKKQVMLPEDGLMVSWAEQAQGDIVFVNPPYGRQVKTWVQKCVDEAANGAEVVLLVAARVDTKWFQELIFETATAVCFLKGRVRFINALTGSQKDPSFFPSAVVYWGSNIDLFADAFADKGHLMINFVEEPVVFEQPLAAPTSARMASSWVV